MPCDRTELQNSPALTRLRERLARIRGLGWPLAGVRSPLGLSRARNAVATQIAADFAGSARFAIDGI